MRSRYPGLILGSILICLNVFSQSPPSTTLKNVSIQNPNDSAKVDSLNKLFLEFEFVDGNKAKGYLGQALSLAKKINYKKGIAATITFYGYHSEDKGDYLKALENYTNALEIYRLLNDQQGMANSYNYIGIIHFDLGNYPEALKNYFLALKIKESLNDKSGSADVYNNIGLIYSSQDDYKKALEHYNKSLKIYQEQDNKNGLALSYNNLGIIYRADGDYRKALSNYFSSLEIDQSIENVRGIASSYNNIGNVYSDLKEYKKSQEYLLKSLKLRQEIGDRVGISGCFINLGDMFMKQKKFHEAEKYFLSAKKMMKESANKEYLREIYKALTTLDSAKGDFRSSYKNMKMYVLYRDSLDNEETRRKTIQSQMAYDFGKKEAVAAAAYKKELEKQNALADVKSRKQSVIISFAACSLFIVLLFVAYVLRSLRITRRQKKLIEEQKELVEEQKLVVQRQKHQVEEHRQAVLDSITYARRIQLSQFPTEQYISRNLVRLRNQKGKEI